jgi:hypothetical protein
MCCCLSLHSSSIEDVLLLLLSYFADGETEAQRDNILSQAVNATTKLEI